jgi:predicted nucleic acid-binding protein
MITAACTAALASNCRYLISEDLQDGLIINDRVKVVNIFKHLELLENALG